MLDHCFCEKVYVPPRMKMDLPLKLARLDYQRPRRAARRQRWYESVVSERY